MARIVVIGVRSWWWNAEVAFSWGGRWRFHADDLADFDRLRNTGVVAMRAALPVKFVLQLLDQATDPRPAVDI